MGVAEGEERGDGVERTYEERMTKTCPYLMKIMNVPTQEA